MEFTQHEKHKHQAVFPTSHRQSACPHVYAPQSAPAVITETLRHRRIRGTGDNTNWRDECTDSWQARAYVSWGRSQAEWSLSAEKDIFRLLSCVRKINWSKLFLTIAFLGGDNLILLCLSNKGVFPSHTVNILLNAAANDGKGLTLRIWQHASKCPVIWARPIYCLKKGKSQSELNARMFTTARINCDCDS